MLFRSLRTHKLRRLRIQSGMYSLADRVLLDLLGLLYLMGLTLISRVVDQVVMRHL